LTVLPRPFTLVRFVRRHAAFVSQAPHSEEWMSLKSPALFRLRALAPVTAGAFLAACAGEHPQTTFRPVTSFAAELNRVFAWTTWWTIGILAVVHILLLYIIVRYRHRDDAPEPRPIHGHTGLEIFWTVVPAIIVVIIAVPTVRGIWASQPREPENALVIDAIGHQWWWEFRYPEYDLVTANQFHIPVGRPIRLRMHSADVIHSFWIPRLGGKRDLNPMPAQPERQGHGVNYLTFTVDTPGQYDGQCAEFCGMSHAIMRMRAIAETPEAFAAWVQRMSSEVTAAVDMPQQPPAAPRLAADTADAALAARGRELFLSRACIACHTVAGTHARGVLGPSLTLYGERWTVGAGAAANTQENLERWIRHPQAMKPAARMPGTAEGAAGMPPTMLQDDEVRAIAAYLLSLR
jgi:cytochrome c oxidase subunit II